MNDLLLFPFLTAQLRSCKPKAVASCIESMHLMPSLSLFLLLLGLLHGQSRLKDPIGRRCHGIGGLVSS